MRKINSVLLVDDNETDLYVTKKIIELNDLGKEIISARNEDEALKLLGDFYNKNQCLPELIIVDHQINQKNGLDLIKKIKANYHFLDSKTQIILLSAGIDRDEDKIEIEKFGIKDILIKPLEKEDLRRVLSN